MNSGHRKNSGREYRGAIGGIGLLQCLACALLLTLTAQAGAQHAGHTMDNVGDMELNTMPADDAVLASAPRRLMLHFAAEVRLVKLALRNDDSEFIDIGFRYRPGSGHDFSQALPRLATADYYRVEWAAIDGSGVLNKGEFHFSFGADARPPSYWLNQQEEMRHIMAPDYRLLGPSLQN